MVRRNRQFSKSGIYHVMTRGIKKDNIFYDDEDRYRFLDIVREKKKGNEYTLYAYCLMDNHVHLLLKEEKDTISRSMKRINTTYAYYFNNKYDRVGYVFQDRFKSEPIEKENYLLEAIRYIHNNPVKAGLIDNPSLYNWSSYNIYLNTLSKSEYKDLVDCGYILNIFSDKTQNAKDLFKEFTLKENNDKFIDYEIPQNSQQKKHKSIKGYKEAEVFYNQFLKKNKLNELSLKEHKTIRNRIIKILKNDSNLSIREIASLLKVSKSTVHRA